jgi:glycosyltransferase involved in cell wall biosynthesis
MTDKDNTARRHCMIVFAAYPLSETRVQREAEALLRYGYEVDVICLRLRDEAAMDTYKGVRIYREKYRFPMPQTKRGGLRERFLNYLRFFVSAAVRLNKLHAQRPYDTIQVHNLPDFLVFCALIPKLRGVPVILDLHDLMPEFYAGRFGQSKSLIARLICWQERLACRFADHVITVSEHWKQALIRRGVPAHKCSVVMNVADESIFHPLKDECLRSPGQDGFRLIYHGAIVERYGLDLAVRAIDQVRHDIPDIHLSLVGRGEHLPYLTRMIEELGLSQHVTLDKLHLAEELPDIIRSCDLGIVPYRNDVFTDGLLPTKLMEYAALGLPAIAARTTAIQAYFSDTLAEFFVPGDVDDLARCMRALHDNPARLAELARGCQRFNQRYNWTQIGADYVALVERLRSDRVRAGRGTIQQDSSRSEIH